MRKVNLALSRIDARNWRLQIEGLTDGDGVPCYIRVELGDMQAFLHTHALTELPQIIGLMRAEAETALTALSSSGLTSTVEVTVVRQAFSISDHTAFLLQSESSVAARVRVYSA